MSMLQPVKAESLSAQVAETIREAIFRGELKPGQVLRELGLAKSLRVSQATVREALSHLEHYGLVVRTPNRSTSVTSLSPKEVKDRMKVWVALETLAFTDAAKRINEDEMREIEQLNAAVSSAIASRDSYEVMNADRMFHQRIWEMAGNASLARILDQLTTPVFAFMRGASQAGSPEPASHNSLLQALRGRDHDKIAAAVVRHIEGPIATALDMRAQEAPIRAESTITH
ncbi:MAG: hypothetical protein IANPNBLG_03746 [Bryobacteraceae bacterium]|nr:hypothetical protein [Bryobacteraceae bacterium]